MDHYLPAPYFAAFFWGLAVLFGMIGLGRLTALAIGGEEAPKAGWGLHAVWGMAVYLLFGGCLAVFHACTDTAITALIGLGLASLVWTTARAGWPTRAELAALPWQTWPSFALAALSLAASVGWQMNINYSDDLGAYFTFCEKLLVTGSFDEPFSWRRLASLGGNTMLQGSVLVNTSFCNIQMFEIGLCPVIMLGLITGFRQGSLVRTPLGTFLAFVISTAPILRFNTASHYTGIVVFMGLFVTLDYLERTDARRRWLMITGILAAAFCTLRAQNIAATGLALGLYWIGWWLRDRPPFRRVLIDGLWCCGALLVALLPWSYMSYRSNQSPLFPLFLGGHSLAFNPVGLDGTFYDKFRLVIQMLGEMWLIPLFLALLALPPWRKSLAAWAVAVAAVVTSGILAYGCGLAPDNATIPRYVQPLLLVGAFATLVTAAGFPRLRLAVWILATIGLVSGLERRSLEIRTRYEAFGYAEKSLLPMTPKSILQYRQAQLLVPAGKRVLAITDFPFLFDHTRNEIWNIDLPHAASPRPGLPYGQPTEATKRYLREQGVEYFIYVDFDQSFGALKRENWVKHSTGEIKLFRIEAPFYFDFFATIDGLAASETVLGKSGALTVVQLKP